MTSTVDRVQLRVNGSDRAVDARPLQSLLTTLRDTLGLTSVRDGCGVGMCGACTVLVDGEPVSSCLALAWTLDGSVITTLEGLSQGGLHPVQQAFLDCGAFQCSYCTPGFVLATVALLAETPHPSREAAAEYLSGHICRCGSYLEILDAVAQSSRQETTP